MSEGKTKEYSNSEVTVIWKPDLCIHSENCVNALPEVFRPDERPWIRVEEAGSEKIIEAVNKCPSGALSYRTRGEIREELEELDDKVRIRASRNGPFIVEGGKVELLDADGNPCAARGRSIALCRCGASGNKPFCDGSHKEAGFESES